MTDLAGPKVLTEERVAHIMKTLYLFHDVWTHYPKADWLAAHYPVEGFVVIKKTRPWFGKYLWKRSRRLGFPKVLDELAFRLYWLFFKSLSDRIMTKKLLGKLKRDLPENYKRPPIYRVYDINSSESEALLKKLAPDVCVLTVHPIIKEKIFSIPRLGMLVFHPGVTPEYRGPHSAFWATLNNQFWGVGWSLLRIDKDIDTVDIMMDEPDELQGFDGLREILTPQQQIHVFGVPYRFLSTRATQAATYGLLGGRTTAAPSKPNCPARIGSISQFPRCPDRKITGLRFRSSRLMPFGRL